MIPPRRIGWLVPVLGASTLLVCGNPGWCQLAPFLPKNGYELDDTVQLDRAESTERTHLERAKAYLADQQWDEAVETLRRVMEESGNKLLGVAERRYIGLRDYCHLQVASLPAEALALYRSRVDPVAGKWYEEGIARRDRRLLADVVEQMFASSWGDDALLALGDMSLEAGDYAAARDYWEKIIPVDPATEGAASWMRFPDTDLELAAIRARLVLVSILEGAIGRAREELAQFTRLHPDARGHFGGREVNYAEALAEVLAESSSWPRWEPSPDWPTFAGSPARTKVAPASIDVAEVAWRVPLDRSAVAGSPNPAAKIPRVAENADAPLSYHPVLAGNLVLVNNQAEILAIDARTGKPAWGNSGPAVFRDQDPIGLSASADPPNTLGVPRFTMTVFGGRVYARMGTAITSRPPQSSEHNQRGYLVCIDLEAEGRLVWNIEPEEPGWAFEGSPVVDGTNVYVAMRRSDIRPQAHVACFDAETGRRQWRRFVCGAETPARGILYESTHNLLTLERETIYYNTNLGAVAALSTRDGQVKWVALYPRQCRGNLLKPAPHTCRDLNPCVYSAGTLLVAPQDSQRIFAIDAATGHILWQTGSQVEDVVHLLGVTGDQLVASGYKLYWISLKLEDQGKITHVWPDGHEQPGYGRGLLAGDCVYWPTRGTVHVFDQATARLTRVIQLAPREAGGGNLLAVNGHLLIATADELIAFAREGRARPKSPDGVAWRVPRLGVPLLRRSPHVR